MDVHGEKISPELRLPSPPVVKGGWEIFCWKMEVLKRKATTNRRFSIAMFHNRGVNLMIEGVL